MYLTNLEALQTLSFIGLPWGLSSKGSACNAGDPGSIPGQGRSRGRSPWRRAWHSGILAWRIPIDWVAWWATVHSVTKSQTRLKWHSTHALTEVSLYKHDWLNHWPITDSTSCPSLLLEVGGRDGTKNSTPSLHLWFPWQPAPNFRLPKGFPKSHLLTYKSHLYHSYQRKFQGF